MKERPLYDRRRTPDLTSLVWRPLAAMLLVAVLLYLAISPILDRATRQSIRAQAERDATDWVLETLYVLPHVSSMAETGRASPLQQRVLDARLDGGDVFLMKIYDTNGRVRFVSNENMLETELGHEHSDEVLEVADNNLAVVEIVDGRAFPGRPETYVEAYVPAVDRDGNKWVIEAYVDASVLAGSLRAQLGRLSAYFVLGGLLVYLVPATVLLWRTRQLRKRDMDLLAMSQRDNLTGIANRATAALEYDRLLKEALEANEPLVLFYLDVDHFKSINDSMGHAAGDEILKRVARALSGAGRPGDIAARFGGDEFVLILRERDGRSPEDVAADIIAGVNATREILGQSVNPGVSIGGYRVVSDESFDQALSAADTALYEAKTAGRGQFVLHSEALTRRNARRSKVERRVREALANRAFYLEYQPIYCGRAERLMGFEALLRLQDEDGSQISPVEFIPVAEDIGLIRDLGAFVLNHAMAVAAGWPEEVYIAVNVSAAQFGDGHFPRLVEDELERTGMSPARLELELTESVFLSDADTHGGELAELKSLGVTLALDDFGTGFSSLAYLWRFPFDKLKIDRAFLEGFEYDSDKYREFISTIVLLGHRLDMRVTAEGVETTDQLAMLETVGVEGYQGYLLGRPLPEPVAIDYAHRRPPPALMVLDH